MWLVLAFASALCALCAGALLHARSMTRFVSGGARTADPEDLRPMERLAVLLGGVRVPRPENLRTPSSLGLRFETHHLQCAHGPSLELWRLPVEEPRGLVLLCHGYAASKDQLLETASALHQAGWAALLLDFAGSGGSSGHTTTLGHGEARDLVATAAWAREQLGDEAQNLVLYGFSMGSAAILRAVGELGLAPAAVVLESPFDRLLTTVRHRFEAMGVPSLPAAHLLVFWGGAIRGFDAFAHNPVDHAAGVAAPALVVIGGLDPRVRVAEARAVADACAGELAVFDEVGHEPLVEADPDGWRSTVLPFLASL